MEKKSPYAAEQDTPELKALREAWRNEIATVDPSRLVFLEESGTNTQMARRYGRAPRGERIREPIPQGHYKTITLTAAVRLDGVGACLTFDGATDAACFEAYIGRCLVPTLKPDDIVIMDNLPCHKSAETSRLIRSAGAEVRYLPAYSPDLNPIEEMFSKLKASLRKTAARTVDALIDAIGDGLRSVNLPDIAGWFSDAGYRYKQA